ncbi:MAG TPA: hypothetical protein VHU92_14630 [Streptosporangiaceae bacterium]|nr:hypothetical protein [Streptosporangiaceae bacterium]
MARPARAQDGERAGHGQGGAMRMAVTRSAMSAAAPLTMTARTMK